MPTNQDLRRIRRHLAELPNGRGRRFSHELRDELGRYARARRAAGATNAAIAVELGVSAPSVARALARRTVVPVRVVEDPRVQQLMVRGPHGVLVEGLDIEGVALLLRALS